MTFQIERVRTAIFVRNSRGYYRIVYFAFMPRERVVELLHEYGIEAGEVLSVETVGIRTAVEIIDERVMTLLQREFRGKTLATEAGGGLQRQAVIEWVEETLQGVMPRGWRLCPLPESRKKELYSMVYSIFKAL